MKQTTDRIWFKAKLLPAANSIFTEAFYPEPNKQGNRYVYFSEIENTVQNPKVIIASRFAENSFRMLSANLAQHCLEPKYKATKDQMAELNKLSTHLERNL